MAEQTTRIIFRATPAHRAALAALGQGRRQSAVLRMLIERAAKEHECWPIQSKEDRANGKAA